MKVGVIKQHFKHDGCDLCIFECENPIILSINGKKYKGHKDCMRKIQHLEMKNVSASRHSIK